MNDHDKLIGQARVFESQGRFASAVAKYRQVIESGRGDLAIAYQGLGRALVRLGHLDKGVEACRKALELNSDLPLAHGVLGYVHLMRKEYELAETEYRIAMCLQPDDPISLINLALALAAMERFSEAVQLFERVLLLQPKNWKARILLVIVRARQRHIRSAMSELTNAFKLRPALPRRYLLVYVIVAWAGVWQCLRLHAFASRLLLTAGLMLFPLLTPTYISIPVGLLIGLFFVLLVLAQWFVVSDKGKLPASLAQPILVWGVFAFFYWLFILVHAYAG